ncbi:hypothetical protein L6452_08091 [Arctium lappa]|uniref:Uncharacterized protein n=1 Tax=Arctium lappa TaxID=4217 RepID=A0ACB9DGK0_ARCLA|nr:hypothetical protein L6452_08091 [Arctium lappa]
MRYIRFVCSGFGLFSSLYLLRTVLSLNSKACILPYQGVSNARQLWVLGSFIKKKKRGNDSSHNATKVHGLFIYSVHRSKSERLVADFGAVLLLRPTCRLHVNKSFAVRFSCILLVIYMFKPYYGTDLRRYS